MLLKDFFAARKFLKPGNILKIPIFSFSGSEELKMIVVKDKKVTLFGLLSANRYKELVSVVNPKKITQEEFCSKLYTRENWAEITVIDRRKKGVDNVSWLR